LFNSAGSKPTELARSGTSWIVDERGTDFSGSTIKETAVQSDALRRFKITLEIRLLKLSLWAKTLGSLLQVISGDKATGHVLMDKYALPLGHCQPRRLLNSGIFVAFSA